MSIGRLIDENRYYNFASIQVAENRAVEIDRNCNSISFLNIGTTIATVNGIPLHPGAPGTNNGESFSIPGNAQEIFKGRVDVGFTGGAGLLLVIQKFYVDL